VKIYCGIQNIRISNLLGKILQPEFRPTEQLCLEMLPISSKKYMNSDFNEALVFRSYSSFEATNKKSKSEIPEIIELEMEKHSPEQIE